VLIIAADEAVRNRHIIRYKHPQLTEQFDLPA
jgi:hypothetical protein